MSLRKGLTTLVVQAAGVSVAYRWNMGLREAVRTFTVLRGKRHVVACGPFIVEW